MTKNTTTNKDEFDNIVNTLVGDDWKGLAIAQYNISLANGLSHSDAIKVVLDKILEVANKKINT